VAALLISSTAFEFRVFVHYAVKVSCIEARLFLMFRHTPFFLMGFHIGL
jgi:hypothetical protein